MDYGNPAACLLTVKLLLNSVLSTPGAKFLGMDLNDLYLSTPMERPGCSRMNFSNFPDDVIEHYGLKDKVDKYSFVFVKYVLGMYGLPHAKIIAQELLEERLEKHWYHQNKTTPGLWMHETQSIRFSLIVDDFGVMYVGKEQTEYLEVSWNNIIKSPRIGVVSDTAGSHLTGIMQEGRSTCQCQAIARNH